jgi:hypothetical protein
MRHDPRRWRGADRMSVEIIHYTHALTTDNEAGRARCA